MKFCMECGFKIVYSGGQVPKYCPNCGESLGAKTSKASFSIEAEEESSSSNKSLRVEDFAEITASFDGVDDDSATFKGSDLLGTKKEGDSKAIRSKKPNFKESQARMKSKDSLDA